MKILQLIYESYGSPFGFGGAGVRAYEIYKRLKDRHDITLLCMKYPGALDKDIEGLRHIFVGTESKSLTKTVAAYTLKADHYVRRHGNNFDIIIENFLPATPFFSRFLTKTPVILQIQGIMGLHSLKKYNLLYGLPMYIMEKVYPLLYKRFIFVTDVNIDRLSKRALRFDVITNGIDEGLLHANKEDGDYILFLSRIDTYTKGLDILIKAFIMLSDKFNDIRLILAGYEFNKASELIERLPERLRYKVRYAGFVSGKEKIDLLSKAKIFVLPSRHEANPVSIIEALACGCAVLVSDIQEIKYVSENKIGLTFKSGSSEDLTEKLAFLLENKILRQQFGENGRRYAFQFLWDDIALKFERFLMEIVQSSSKAKSYRKINSKYLIRYD